MLKLKTTYIHYSHPINNLSDAHFITSTKYFYIRGGPSHVYGKIFLDRRMKGRGKMQIGISTHTSCLHYYIHVKIDTYANKKIMRKWKTINNLEFGIMEKAAQKN
jgi:hypothetical protein